MALIDSNGDGPAWLGRDPADELVRARESVAQAQRQADAFTHMSHEVRTLLNGMIGLTGLVLDTELTAEQRDYAKRIRSSGDTLIQLLNNVLDYGKLSQSSIEIERVDFDLRRSVEEVGELLAERAHAKGIELVVTLADSVQTALRGDPVRLRQILINLVSNAIKFTERGEVVLHVVSAEEAGDRVVVRFEVSDTGLGINAEGRARLFQPFTQVHDTSTRSYGGTGLGLALTKRLVEAMGGAIGVESELGHGSTFGFTARFERRPQVIDRSTIPRVDVNGRRALVAAASATLRRAISETILSLEIDVSVASSAGEAIFLLREGADEGRPFDVAIIDALLDDMDGGALVRAIDADEAITATRVIAMAYPGQRFDDVDPRAAKGTRGDGPRRIGAQLAKPVRKARLTASLLRLMGSAMEQFGARDASPREREVDAVGPLTTRRRETPPTRSASLVPQRPSVPPAPPLPPGSVMSLGIAAAPLMPSDLMMTMGASAPKPQVAPLSTRAPTGALPRIDASGRPKTGSAMVASAPSPWPDSAGRTKTGPDVGRTKTGPDERAAEITPRAPAGTFGLPPPPALDPGAPPSPGPRLLLVEDNEVNQRIAIATLEKRGYQVDLAKNGIEALLATNCGSYTAILMDCQMPELDGYGATERIRKREGAGKRTPIIAMTAEAGPGARERCMAVGMDDYMSKPIVAEELDRVLRTWAPRFKRAEPTGKDARDQPLSLGAPSAPVDLRTLEQLRKMRREDEPDLAMEVIDLFLHDAPERLAVIREALQAEDLPVVARAAHSLRGSAGHLGAKTLAGLCNHLEQKARKGAPFDVIGGRGIVESIQDEFARVRAVLVEEAERIVDTGW